jgi:hypothetical protein
MRSVPAAFIVVLLVFPLFLAALLTLSVSTWVLDRGFYTALIDDERLYEIPPVVDKAGWDWAARSTGIALFRDPALLREVLTASSMRSQALSVLNEAFDFIDGRSQIFDPSIDLVPLKKAAAAKGGARAALAARTPDRIRLSEMPGTRYVPPRWWGWSGFSALGALVLADVILLALACGSWVAAAFVGGATARERMLWLGGSLLPPSLLVFLCGLGSLAPLAGGWILPAVQSAGLETFGYGPGFTSAVFEAARHAAGRIATGFLATGGVTAGIGTALLVWAMTLGNQASAQPTKEGSV